MSTAAPARRHRLNTMTMRIFVTTLLTSLLSAGLMAGLYYRDRQQDYLTRSLELVTQDGQRRMEQISAWIRSHPGKAVPFEAGQANTNASDFDVDWRLAPIGADGRVDRNRMVGWASFADGGGGIGATYGQIEEYARTSRDALTPEPSDCLPRTYPTRGQSHSSSGDGQDIQTDWLLDAYQGPCHDLLVYEYAFELTQGTRSLGRWAFYEYYRPWGNSGAPFGMTDPLRDLRRKLWLWTGAAVLASAVLAALLAAGLGRPVSRVSRMAARMAEGDLDVRVPVEGRNDLTELSRSMNAMADRLGGTITSLERSEAVQRRFTSDVAHELRTPTAALLSAATALEDPATRDEAAVRVAPQLRRLSALTEDLLEISRMDAGQATVTRAPVDLTDLAREVAAEHGPGVRVQGLPAPAVVDPVRTRIALSNLVRNALAHGASPVDVTVVPGPVHTVIDVTDAGGGVPAAIRETVFDRFVRGDAARHGSSSGLGLAIARENARLQGGDLTLDPSGRVFSLDLPTRPTDRA